MNGSETDPYFNVIQCDFRYITLTSYASGATQIILTYFLTACVWDADCQSMLHALCEFLH